jgi:AraC-like DNA-binding protein
MDVNDAEAGWLGSVLLGSLDEKAATGDLARRAYHSRSHFYRLHGAILDETPGAMRRRLLLERSAWQLAHTAQPVTGIALDAQYGSLEAFTRAFRKAFGVSPSLYRRMGATHYRLHAPNGIHFHQPGPKSKGNSDMDLFDRFSGSETWHTRRLLQHAKSLTDEQLDKPLKNGVRLCPWESPDRNLRQMLERIVFTKEVWTAALTGRTLEGLGPSKPEGDSPEQILARFEKVDAEFNRILREVRDRGGWDDVFVDALCQPPETFTFGGMFAHVLTFNTYRRLSALALMRQLGIDESIMGCPTEFERDVAPWRDA